MILSVASGKGGTGKTTIATSLVLSVSDKVQLLDCDVEEPNAHIFIKPKIFEKKPVMVSVPAVNASICTGCGKCAEVCAFNAIAVVSNKVLIHSDLCHHCGACEYFCPTQAMQTKNKAVGMLEIGEKNRCQFIQGRLNVGEMMPTPVIKAVKKYIDLDKTTIIDVPPGTACAMIEAVRGSNFCILVTEPTPFGLNDLKLAVETLQKLKIPFGVIINRSDLGNEDVRQYCQQKNISILMEIPFQKEIAVAYSNGIPLVEAFPEYQKQFQILITSKFKRGEL